LNSTQPTLGILVSGGPAPGINSVIASATIEAVNEGCRVLGIYDGFQWLAQGETSRVAELGIADVSRIHGFGGSVLRTSRTNISKDPTCVSNITAALKKLGVTHLLCIGGDGTIFNCSCLTRFAELNLQICTVPKTIDNDIPLPDNMPTFGFESARAIGASIVDNLMEDARTTTRWFLVVTMGRASGALALGICKAAGATLAVIPEEFPRHPVPLRLVADTIVGSIIKRKAVGRSHGVAVIAEGLAERLDPAELETLRSATRDVYGNVRLTELDLGDKLRHAVSDSVKELGLPVTIVAKDVGYELRCARPIAFDVEYTRTLGYGAVRFRLSGGSAALVCLRGGKVAPVPFSELIDERSGRARTRLVDTSTEAYEVGRKYMIRLEAADLLTPRVSALAAAARLNPGEFQKRFEPLAHTL
jgi:ATP-dependent phosphofructokinase / diphosphate-dependent phosphofructokinase